MSLPGLLYSTLGSLFASPCPYTLHISHQPHPHATFSTTFAVLAIALPVALATCESATLLIPSPNTPPTATTVFLIASALFDVASLAFCIDSDSVTAEVLSPISLTLSLNS
ncbi:hypothetical protein AX774_g4083 [Zancudomyces culisetae]|uniref:Uncharacterized protein n=1 Tax=Zancudomyces culisetae TaxID=1213189 RepID=A0A1R1PHB6_ZANCU|nr:hypothetical protein AX774_g7341 [Zancudomyces culisetae]OMH80338.1 hypothetical protein AX774_g6229 [Zancudomyces culisetae]OMH82426.1 hypothetical protein AX774_g4083 [Zancudomyces culisetae]|eukprot:OMH79253.1 hypothetical protein AX774_g7341 [Zancudomyces culisetae]